jgi:hypothetical protein
MNNRDNRNARPRGKLHVTAQAGCGFLIIASGVIGANCDENWELRATAGIVFLTGILGLLVSLVVNPKFGFIGPKLSTSSFAAKVVIEIFFRLIMLGLGLFVTPILFNMYLDIYDLVKGGHPMTKEAVVTYVPSGALWSWAWKDIGLQASDGTDFRYNVFFHPQYPTQGQRYEVVLLPKSKCVLSLEKIE